MPLTELAVVRMRVPKIDERGRAVAVGTLGAIVHLLPRTPGEPQACIVEIVLVDERGMQNDAILLDVFEEEVELV